MKQNKRTAPAELSYYGLYLLDYLRKYHPDKVSDTGLISGREEAASETFEKARRAGSSTEAAQEEAMRVLLEGLHFSPFALSPEHDLLYTELTGTVMLYLESYGVQ